MTNFRETDCSGGNHDQISYIDEGERGAVGKHNKVLPIVPDGSKRGEIQFIGSKG